MEKNPRTGKYVVVFKPGKNIIRNIEVPCGQCAGCRLERSRVWAIRCMHENQLHQESHFLTLTYNDENLPDNNSLLPSDLQKFYKRLRKRGKKFRYYSCGEYGELNKRPHYHAILFGLELNDRNHFTNFNGQPLYTSEEISRVWNCGHVVIGNVSFESCAYVARYIMKKRLGPDAWKNYGDLNKETGEIENWRIPEFTTMSRKPGIGKEWYDKYKNDVYQHGTDGKVIIRGGIPTIPPRFYEDKFNLEQPIVLDKIKHERRKKADEKSEDNTWRRLEVKEKVFEAKIKSLKRTV